ncbi:Asp-tRNA(Asn)/Glu-tRNA(Gln) amidotransferase subunit GatA [Helicobacter sp. MIT 01-3238]|uniref:Asp-tRNA(Asn)/Glu-tRNA(Gln) amidotransferase subunit GatA n=1 Tax=Helicobacter sp. MIT 01-3238 TaxID=398627 RepID=UPI000E1EC553|nr:Asp-tRNA(Asn)/Glu-tRNA(Gln) amidotransferase subunit GatA [Helicobacter sp. MIT 01-3238]RDU52669.1 Asp-tRNA(Asn)/Glu-tRNA(Gln) amidotransferase GatCAB subunit A [Helicobacter sp. MIT 01-3238]
MITLKQALSLSKPEQNELKSQIQNLVKQSENAELNAYIDFSDDEVSGVPILIKDNISVKGWEITCASKILKGYKSPYNATVIENLHTNGMSAFGRANMDEFAMGSTTESSCYGRTKNPCDTSCVPGGSSGGSAAAVAGGLAIAALGSDTGGSIRQPAGYCGCVGLKPTYGRVSRYGLIAYSSSLDQIGPITQNVEDCAILLDAISGGDERDSTSARKAPLQCFSKLDKERGFKIAVLRDFIKDADSSVAKAYENTIKVLESSGNEILPKKMLDTNFHISTYYIICTAEASSNLARFDGVRYGNRAQNADTNKRSLKDLYLSTRSNGFGTEVKNRILLGSFVLSSGYYDAYYLKAQKMRSLIRAQFDEIFKDADLILCPVAPSIAPKFRTMQTPLQMYLNDIYTIGVNLAGLPAISIPVGKDSDGLPIGMQLIGKHFDEQSVLDCAYALESALS